MIGLQEIRAGLAAMAGTRKKPGGDAPKANPEHPPARPPKPVDEELYESGDICGPEPDRDDEQRDL
jgi:hypothetical protein